MKRKFIIVVALLAMFVTCCTTKTDELKSYTDSDWNYHLDSLKSISPIISSYLIGTWVNTVDSLDKLQVFDSSINRWDLSSNGYFHFYTYKLAKDSIILNYTGIYKVGTHPYHRKIQLNINKDTLVIIYLNTVYPGYPGWIFRRINKN